MRILFVSHNHSQSAITVQHTDGLHTEFETYLFNDNGHSERHNIAHNLEDAIMSHRYLCEKCGIKVNI